jgi:hypothetical protein
MQKSSGMKDFQAQNESFFPSVEIKLIKRRVSPYGGIPAFYTQPSDTLYPLDATHLSDAKKF